MVVIYVLKHVKLCYCSGIDAIVTKIASTVVVLSTWSRCKLDHVSQLYGGMLSKTAMVAF